MDYNNMEKFICLYLVEQALEKSFQETITAMKRAGADSVKKMLPDTTTGEQKTIVERAWKSILEKMQQEEILEEEALPKKPRMMTREEFFALSDEDEEVFSFSGEYPELAEQSLLRKHGYCVSKNEGLSKKARQDLLKHLISTGVVSKGYAITLLKGSIKRGERKPGCEHAVACWRSDLAFVLSLSEKTEDSDWELPF